jgi:hypothetical protein
MSSSKVKAGSKLFPTDPVTATSGAVSSWFSLAHPSSVVTGSGYSSVRDILNPSSPATQSTDARRPPAAVSTNGLPIVTVSASTLSVPLISARIGTTTWGFWGWLKQSPTADAVVSFGTSGGASANFAWFNFNTTGTNCKAELWTGAQSRRCEKGSLSTGVWKFLTIEFNGALSGDARYTLTIDAAPQTVTFGGSLGSVPATLPVVTGPGSLLSFTSAGGFPFVGSLGTNFGFFGSAMSGVSAGLLTPAARLALMNYQRPT